MLYKPSFSADRSLSLASITDKFIWRDISSGVKLPTDSSWNDQKITNFILISKLLTWFIKSCLTSSSVLLEVIKTKTPDWNWCSLMGRWLSFSDLAAWRISSETRVSNHQYIDLEIIAASKFLCLGAVHKLRHFKIDLYGSSNNDSTWCYIPSGVLNNDEWLTKFTFFDILPIMCVKIIKSRCFSKWNHDLIIIPQKILKMNVLWIHFTPLIMQV